MGQVRSPCIPPEEIRPFQRADPPVSWDSLLQLLFLPLPGAWAGSGTHPGCGPHMPARCAPPSSWRRRGSQGCSGDQGGRRAPGPGRSECWGQGTWAHREGVQGSTEPHLAQEGDRRLPHGLCVPDVSSDDLSEGLLYALWRGGGGGMGSDNGPYRSHRPCLIRPTGGGRMGPLSAPVQP